MALQSDEVHLPASINMVQKKRASRCLAGLQYQRQRAVKILSTTENLYSCLTIHSWSNPSYCHHPTNIMNKVQYILHILFYHLNTKLFSQINLIQKCSNHLPKHLKNKRQRQFKNLIILWRQDITFYTKTKFISSCNSRDRHTTSTN